MFGAAPLATESNPSAVARAVSGTSSDAPGRPRFSFCSGNNPGNKTGRSPRGSNGTVVCLPQSEHVTVVP